jgi:alpha-mannosidase
MQQILSKSGVPYMIISRYHEGLYRWQSPDGSSVLAYSPGHYGNSASMLNAAPAEGVKAIAANLEKWSPYYAARKIAPVFPILHSEDFSQPKDFGPLISAWNGRPSAAAAAAPSSKLEYSSAAGFFKAIDQPAAAFDKVLGERPNLWLYIHGPTHHWAVSAHREAGALLPAAETFSVVDSLLAGNFKSYPSDGMQEAWMSAIYPDHGWGGKEGQVTDRLFRKTYEQARDWGWEMLDRALRGIAPKIKPAPVPGLPVVLFNSLSWERTGPAIIFNRKPAGTLAVKDGQGRVMPAQILPPLPDQPAGVVRIEFIASGVPALGYKTFYLTEDKGVPESPSTSAKLAERVQGSVYENDFYKVTFGPGGLKSIFDKELGSELLNTRKFQGFEVFTMRSVGSGAGEFGRVQQPTMEGFDKLSAHNPGWALEPSESGPVKTVFSLKQSLSDCTVREKIIIYDTLKRIDCEIELRGWDGSPYREYRVALPVASPDGKVAYEVPMGVVEVGTSEAAGTGGPAYGSLVYDEEMSKIRPREVQNFLNVSGAAFGLTLSTCVAVNDYQDPTTDPVGYPVLQAVLLASRRSCHSEGNWYLQEGDHAYRFSVVSHASGWRNGYKAGIGANVPFYAVIGPRPDAAAALPDVLSFFGASAGNIVFSTIKKAEDDDSVVVRCYDIEGRDSHVEIRSFAAFDKAEKVNMIEEAGPALAAGGSSVKLRIGHHAIETLKLRPAAAKKN